MKRRGELLDAVVEYLLEHGIGELSLRPLAAAAGTKARLLIYHFGSRQKLIAEAMALVRRRVQEAFLEKGDVTSFWKWAIDPENAGYLRLVFEVQGLAMQKPKTYGAYLRGSLESWIELLEKRIKGRDRRQTATLVVAVFDGLLLDAYITGDVKRTTRALRRFLDDTGEDL